MTIPKYLPKKSWWATLSITLTSLIIIATLSISIFLWRQNKKLQKSKQELNSQLYEYENQNNILSKDIEEIKTTLTKAQEEISYLENLGFNTQKLEELYKAINEYRQENNLTTLEKQRDLEYSAFHKALHMASYDYFAHESPNGYTMRSFITFSKISYQQAGENLALGFNTPQAVLEGWKNSPEHNAIILDSRYKYIGLGYSCQLSTPSRNITNCYVVMYTTY